MNQLAAVLTARGCSVLNIGRFGISCDSTDDVYELLQQDLGKNDLSILDSLEVAPPPIYFGHKIDGEAC